MAPSELLFPKEMQPGGYVEGRMDRRVVTGLNEAFIIDQAKHDELVAEDPRSRELLSPWLRDRDVNRGDAAWNGFYVIHAHRGVDINRHPAIRAHVESFRARLETRATAPLHPWYELSQP